jgi:hypothetical protein
VPLNSFPSTLHSSYRDQLRIFFHEEHNLVLKTEGGNHHLRVFAEYTFLSADDWKRFQGDVCNKDLVGTFDFNTILLSSKRIPQGGGSDAVLRDLKIWKDRHPPYHHSISFFANTTKERHVEFPILWFQPGVRNDERNLKVVHLDFVMRNQNAPSPSVAVRRRSAFGRVSSLVLGKSPPKGVLTLLLRTDQLADKFAENSLLHSKKASVSSDASKQLPNSDIPNNYRSLRIEFSTREG